MVKKMISVTVIIYLMMLLFCCSTEQNIPSSEKNLSTDVKSTISKLIAYNALDILSQKLKLTDIEKDSIIKITGTVIAQDIKAHIISLGDIRNQEEGSINCIFDGKIPTVKKGGIITIIGKYRGFMAIANSNGYPKSIFFVLHCNLLK